MTHSTTENTGMMRIAYPLQSASALALLQAGAASERVIRLIAQHVLALSECILFTSDSRLAVVELQNAAKDAGVRKVLRERWLERTTGLLTDAQLKDREAILNQSRKAAKDRGELAEPKTKKKKKGKNNNNNNNNNKDKGAGNPETGKTK